MLSDGTNDYEYEGNLIRKTNTVTGEVTEYTWDYRNRLTAVVHKDGQGNVLWSETYVYDAFNRRIAFHGIRTGATAATFGVTPSPAPRRVVEARGMALVDGSNQVRRER